MMSDQWRQVQVLFDEAVELAPAERFAFLAEACGDDAELREEVESLLECDRLASDNFMAPPQPTSSAPFPGGFEDAHALVGAEVGRYRIQRVIATGGMGTVYEALQEQPQRLVALKVMHGALASRSALRRFQFESQVLARLQHRNIAQVFEAGVHTGDRGALPYFAMEYVRAAKTITEHATDRNLSTSDRLLLFATVCDAVHHGHQKGIIHRDLKPANILVDESGEVKVIDFGVARSTDADIAVATQHTREDQFVGTMQYMSPEQCVGDAGDIDTRSDVYALGVVLYELLTDQRPYDTSGVTLIEAARIIREEAPRRPSLAKPALRGDVETIILRALEKDRDRRYASAAELGEDVRRYLRNEPITARPPSTAYLLLKFVQRHRWRAAALLGATLSAIAAIILVIMTIYATRANAQRDRAIILEYGSAINLAETALRMNDCSVARAVLEQTEQELRGWEWQHLWSRIDESRTTLLDLGDAARPNRIAMRPDERLLAVCNEAAPEVVICNFGSGQTELLPDIPANAYRSSAAAFSPDGKVLAVVYRIRDSDDCIIELRDMSPNGKYRPARSWSVCKGDISGLAFHPTDPILASSGKDILLWDLDGGSSPPKPFATLSVGCTVPALSFSPDGTLLAAACGDADEARLWRMSDFRTGNKKELARLSHDHHVLDLDFNSNGCLLATASMDKTVRLWDVETILRQHTRTTAEDDAALSPPEPVEVLYGHTQGVAAVAFDQSGQWLVSGGYDRALRTWEVQPVKDPTDMEGRYWSSLRGHSDVVRDLVTLSDGRIVSASWDGTIKGWNPDYEDIRRIRGFTSSVFAVAFSPSGRYVVAAGSNGNVVLMDAKQADVTPHVRLTQAVRAVDLCCWSLGQTTYVAIAAGHFAGTNGCLSIWDLHDWDEPVWQFPTPESGGPIAFRSVAISQDGASLAAGDAEGSIHVWDVSNLPRVAPVATFNGLHSESINSVVFLDVEGRWLVSASGNERRSEEHSIRIWDCVGKVGVDEVYDKHTDAVTSLSLSKDRFTLASTSNDHTVCLWSIDRAEDPPRLTFLTALGGHIDGVQAAAFHPDGRRLATGSSDRMIKIWDTDTYVEVATLHGHTGAVLDLAFDPDGNRLASASGGAEGTDNVVWVWEAPDNN